MLTLRYDPAHRPGLARTGRPRRRTPRDWPVPAGGDAGMAWGVGREPGPVLSVVVPARNEAAGLPQLVDEVARALRPIRDGDGPRRLSGFEIVIVDDGSTDRTAEILRGLAADYPELKGVVLRPGVGQSSATVAGIRTARGDWIATLDADLQNDPSDLVRLWEALPGYDVALGWRRSVGTPGRGGSSADGPTGCATACWASRSATRGVRSGSSRGRWRCGCRRSAAFTGSSGRSCCARGAGWCRCRSAIDPAPTVDRTTTCGTGRSRWSSTCSASPGCCGGRSGTGWSRRGTPRRRPARSTPARPGRRVEQAAEG